MKKWIVLYSLILTGFASSPDVLAQTPVNKQYSLLEKEVARYERFRNSAWTEISLAGKKSLKLNDSSAIIKTIKERLIMLGDMQKERPGFFRKAIPAEVYSTDMEEAVKRFQLRHGMEDSGIIDAAFIKVVNISPDERINQMRANMDRIFKDTLQTPPGKRIIANIPEYKLYVYEDNREVLSMDIVVGKTSNPTVAFNDMMEHIIFSPYWNVPPNIVRNEILPAMKKNSRYLSGQNMEITGKEDGLPVIRQRPGPGNALGKVKFVFPNKYNIYFHDTPAKTLFEHTRRAFSHGCIRLSQPFELASYLLKDQPGWSDEAIRKAMNSRSEQWVKLDQKVPVFITYYTSWVDPSGVLQFRDDIYGHDNEVVN
jgi:murein L,D-transpeptidase YcbB/YkuD